MYLRAQRHRNSLRSATIPSADTTLRLRPRRSGMPMVWAIITALVRGPMADAIVFDRGHVGSQFHVHEDWHRLVLNKRVDRCREACRHRDDLVAGPQTPLTQRGRGQAALTATRFAEEPELTSIAERTFSRRPKLSPRTPPRSGRQSTRSPTKHPRRQSALGRQKRGRRSGPWFSPGTNVSRRKRLSVIVRHQSPDFAAFCFLLGHDPCSAADAFQARQIVGPANVYCW